MRPIIDYLPHRGKLLLLDELVMANNDQAIAITTPRADSLFATPNGVPALVGIEYIAQTVAAFSCARADEAGQPKIGLLLGSRHYHSQWDFFPIGKQLTITVTPHYLEDDELGVFEGRISLNDETLVSATLNVFQPNNIHNYFTVKKI